MLTSTFNTHYTWVSKQPAQSSYSNYVDSFFFFSLSPSLWRFSFICFSFLCGALLSSSSLSTSFWCAFFYLCIGLWLIFYEQNRLCAMRTRWREFRREFFLLLLLLRMGTTSGNIVVFILDVFGKEQRVRGWRWIKKYLARSLWTHENFPQNSLTFNLFVCVFFSLLWLSVLVHEGTAAAKSIINNKVV